MNQTTAYTDGAARGNPGPAGWAVLIDGEAYFGMVEHATNNEMEIFAIYQAVLNCPANTHLIIHSDSRLAIGLLSLGWKTKFEHLIKACRLVHDTARDRGVQFSFRWVHGHRDDVSNNRVDRLASRQALQMKKRLAVQARRAEALQTTNLYSGDAA